MVKADKKQRVVQGDNQGVLVVIPPAGAPYGPMGVEPTVPVFCMGPAGLATPRESSWAPTWEAPDRWVVTPYGDHSVWNAQRSKMPSEGT